VFNDSRVEPGFGFEQDGVGDAEEVQSERYAMSGKASDMSYGK
jgi:hypothetical protein